MRSSPKLLHLLALFFTLSMSHTSPGLTGSGQRGFGGGQTITCSSDNGRRNYCNVDTRGGVRMTNQRSGSPCVQGQTWGWDNRGIWVDRGCRADFVVGQGGGNWGGQGQTVTCSSNNGGRNYCNIGGANPQNITLTRQISGSPCIRNQTWGVNQRGLWVDRGCRAEFSIGGGGNWNAGRPNFPGQGQIVTCSSNDGRRNWCNIPNRGNVTLSRQISGSACIQGQTWGTDQRGLWVDRGCRAEFMVR